MSIHSRVILIALVLALGAALATSAFLYQQARVYYREEALARLDPLGLNVEWHAVPAKTTRTRVVFFGGSCAAQWQARIFHITPSYNANGSS